MGEKTPPFKAYLFDQFELEQSEADALNDFVRNKRNLKSCSEKTKHWFKTMGVFPGRIGERRYEAGMKVRLFTEVLVGQTFTYCGEEEGVTAYAVGDHIITMRETNEA